MRIVLLPYQMEACSPSRHHTRSRYSCPFDYVESIHNTVLQHKSLLSCVPTSFAVRFAVRSEENQASWNSRGLLTTPPLPSTSTNPFAPPPPNPIPAPSTCLPHTAQLFLILIHRKKTKASGKTRDLPGQPVSQGIQTRDINNMIQETYLHPRWHRRSPRVQLPGAVSLSRYQNVGKSWKTMPER